MPDQDPVMKAVESEVIKTASDKEIQSAVEKAFSRIKERESKIYISRCKSVVRVAFHRIRSGAPIESAKGMFKGWLALYDTEKFPEWFVQKIQTRQRLRAAWLFMLFNKSLDILMEAAPCQQEKDTPSAT